jgi:BirA family biotin operon repressor/biotin-[acetyl-CoA-carboxylase] ligase
VTPDAALERLADGFSRWLDVWREPGGATRIRETWADRVTGIGDTITVTMADETLIGRFAALDDSGALVLDLADGSRRLIMAGDVFMPAARNDAPKENTDAGTT